MFTFWLLMETNLNLHLVFSRLEPAAVGQTWKPNSPDQVSVWIGSRWGSGLGGDRVWVCRGSGLVCRWFLVLSPRRFQNVCR